MNVIVKNLHWIIIAYAAYGLFVMFEEKQEELDMLTQQTPALQTQVQREKTNLARIQEFQKNLDTTKQRVQEVVSQIERAQRQLPSDVNDAEVQELIAGVAGQLRMRSPMQSPGEEENHGFYFAKQYKFQGQGTFLQSLIFLESLTKAERILNVKSLSIKHVEEEVRGRFQIINFETTVESFRYNDDYKEKSGVEEIERQFKIN